MAKQIKHQQSQCCYHNWVAQQRLDLDELLQALNNYPTDLDYLQLITKKIIDHFEQYRTARAQLAQHDAPSFLVPSWGSTFENSFLWIGGCRPSLIIRLVYALCGSQLNAHLTEFLEGVRHGNLGEISSSQLKSIDDLHAKTVKEEDKLSSRVASLQESIADDPLVLIANDCMEPGEWSKGEVVDKIMDTHAHDLYKIMMEADKLRMDILKGMMDILTPLQAVEFLVASKKLHLSLHEWSQRRDIRMGITHLLNPDKPSSSSNHQPIEPVSKPCPFFNQH
ncbi:putative transcription factor TGA like domain-containing protein [Helianthus annuus]|uniref:Transcription factor TGA like domain-containing protein n=1 Tax=Helianthus annuus TaxID=4232 RepID=A0A251SP51_HELAN|nr:protein DOG1-like 3 [Helianthus annuus]KAF5771792.1 putative transcription factor TGA like domain-containing protein [Helianthus annuus]